MQQVIANFIVDNAKLLRYNKDVLKIEKGGHIMNIAKFNRSSLLFTDNERFEEFKTLEDLFKEDGSEKVYKVNGAYIFTGTFGKGCFIKSEGFNITLPSHMIETVEGIRNDPDSVQEINDGKVGVSIYSYTLPDKYPNKTFYSINFTTL